MTGFLNDDASLRSGFGEPYTAHLRPLIIDLRLLRQWKDLCSKNHRDGCKASSERTMRFLRLIDVQRRCLVDSTRDTPFVTLSYA